MVERSLASELLRSAQEYPVVTLTGPRQSGKTTLCRQLFPQKPYVLLEEPDTRAFATNDPRAFLARYSQGAVIDEIQEAPALASYIMGEVDRDPTPGRFILTGSQNLAIAQTVGQSLAGRTAVLTLLPCSYDELMGFEDYPRTLHDALFRGGYPPIYDRKLDQLRWVRSYVATYLERDVRNLRAVSDMMLFDRFLRLCAGRSGQLLNLSALGADAGVSHNTAQAWISVLEATYIVYRLPPFHQNLNKRLVKTPKLYFYDTALMCFLLGITSAEQINSHPLRGPIFETWVGAELKKTQVHQLTGHELYFFRDRHGLEVDFIAQDGLDLVAIECKSGMTIQPDFWASLSAFVQLVHKTPSIRSVTPIVLHGGDEDQKRTNATVSSWRSASQVLTHLKYSARPPRLVP